LSSEPKGDIHALGKDIFCILAEAAVLPSINLGEDVPPESFIDKVKATDATILGMSALITTAYPYMVQVVELLKENGLREGVKVVIGGGATSKDLAEKIGPMRKPGMVMRAFASFNRLRVSSPLESIGSHLYVI